MVFPLIVSFMLDHLPLCDALPAFLYRITLSARDRLYTSEPDVCGRQVLTYKDGLIAETHKELTKTFRKILNSNQSPCLHTTISTL